MRSSATNMNSSTSTTGAANSAANSLPAPEHQLLQPLTVATDAEGRFRLPMLHRLLSLTLETTAGTRTARQLVDLAPAGRIQLVELRLPRPARPGPALRRDAMPEYLSPGVYVEEIDTGAKPIEGVSTSTAGMVGLTERGPVDVPILVTGAGDYARWFGGALDRDDFRNDGLLPEAVEGFFRNGCRRLYVTRVAPDGPRPAWIWLHDERAALNPRLNTLLHAAPVGGGLDVDPLVALDAEGLAGDDTVRVGDGSQAGWHVIAAGITAAATASVLSFPLSRWFDLDDEVRRYGRTPEGTIGGPHTLAAAASRGATQISVESAGADLATLNTTAHLVELQVGGRVELSRVINVVATGGDQFRMTLAQALQSTFPPDGTVVTVLDAAPGPLDTTLTANARAEDVAIRSTTRARPGPPAPW